MFEEKKEKLIYLASSKLEENYSVKKSLIVFLIGFLGNTTCWIIALLAPESLLRIVAQITDYIDKVLYYLLAVPFFFAFLMGFTLYKVVFRKSQLPIVEKEEFLEGYSSHLQKESHQKATYFSIVIGVLNAGALLLSVILLRGL